MKNTMQVTPQQATELMAKGYEIVCYLKLPAPTREHKPRKPRNYIDNNAQIGRSVKGKPPGHGKAAKLWADLDKKFYTDPTITVEADKLRTWIKAAPNGYSSLLSHLINNYKVLRIV